jgi:hypothetical protein
MACTKPERGGLARSAIWNSALLAGCRRLSKVSMPQDVNARILRTMLTYSPASFHFLATCVAIGVHQRELMSDLFPIWRASP